MTLAREIGYATASANPIECIRVVLNEITPDAIQAFLVSMDQPAVLVEQWQGYAMAQADMRQTAYTEALETVRAERQETAEKFYAAGPSTRSILAKHVFRYLDAGVSAAGLMARMQAANADQPAPMPANDLEGLIIWAVQKRKESGHGQSRG